MSFIGHQLPHWWHWVVVGGWGRDGEADAVGLVMIMMMMAVDDMHAGEDRGLYWRDYGGNFSA